MAVNDKDAGALLDTKDNYSAYVSPYFVGHNNRYTKHYYAGAMRIASKMGASGSTYAAGTDEPDLYFYHTDHLGSTTYITDRKEVAQYVAYTPYGETFKEYKNVTPYKFNGKELDQETGYYYYGARYYDPGTALWFGTDPLQHKYPMTSPYVYCNGNPVRFIDPDGREIKIGTWYGRLLARFGVNNFEAKVVKQIELLKTLDEDLNSMITGLEKSSDIYSIKSVSERPQNNNSGLSDGNSYNINNKTVYYDPDNNMLGDEIRPAEAGLAHELGHAENDMNGKSISCNYKAAKKGNVHEQEKVILNEINSIDKENIVRNKMGYEERDYSYFKLKKE